MTNPVDFRQQADNIEKLVAKLEASGDPSLKTAAKDLVQAVMDLHGAALERMVGLLHEAGNPGGMIERLGRDELVRGVLLLYGLHPEDLRARVEAAMQALLVGLRSQDASAELVSLDEGGVVTVHYRYKAGGCGSTSGAVRARIEAALQDAAPDAAAIVLKDMSVSSGGAFVPLTALKHGVAGGGGAGAGFAASPGSRSGD